MRFARWSIVFVLCFALVVPQFAEAATDRPTSRAIKRTTRYINALEARNRRAGLVRRRSASRRLSRRDVRIRTIDRSSATAGAYSRRGKTRTTTLKGTRPSVISKTPVSQQAQRHYHNGVNAFLGRGRTQDKAEAYMYLNFALSDGHPLARAALRKVTRSMTRTEVVHAREFTKKASLSELQYQDFRPEMIRDAQRRRDLISIIKALNRYWNSHEGEYPDELPTQKEMEVCKLKAKTCLGRIDLSLLVPHNLLAIPEDPFVYDEENGTGYYIYLDKEGVIAMYADFGEFEFVVVFSDELE